jgi:hypothetical protein
LGTRTVYDDLLRAKPIDTNSIKGFLLFWSKPHFLVSGCFDQKMTKKSSKKDFDQMIRLAKITSKDSSLIQSFIDIYNKLQ